MLHSCINLYAHSCLKPLSNPLKALFKQLKSCLNHGIHVLFEHGFYLNILEKNDSARLLRNEHLVLIFVDVNVITFLAEWRQKERKTKWRLRMCTAVKETFSWVFRRLQQEFSWNNIKCKNKDQTFLFPCINICRVPRTMFEHSACGFVFNSFLGTRQMKMQEKTCDPYSIYHKKNTSLCCIVILLMFPYVLTSMEDTGGLTGHEMGESHGSYRQVTASQTIHTGRFIVIIRLLLLSFVVRAILTRASDV